MSEIHEEKKQEILDFFSKNKDVKINWAITILQVSEEDLIKVANELNANIIDNERIIIPDMDQINKMLETAATHVFNRSYDQARKLLEQITEINPKSWEAWLSVGEFYESWISKDKAIEVYRKCIELHPEKSTGFYTKIGNIHLNRNKHAEAIIAFQNALEFKEGRGQPFTRKSFDSLSDEDWAEEYMFIGSAFAMLQYIEQGIICYHKALDFIPNNEKVLRLLVAIYLDYYDYFTFPEQGLKYFLEVLEQNPDDSEIHVDIGRYWLKAGNFNKANEYLQKAIKLDPKSPDPYKSLGYYYFEINSYQKSIDHFLKVIELDPNNSKVISTISAAYMRINDFVTALEYAKKSVELDPNDEISITNLSDSMYKLGDKKEAIELLVDFIAQHPKSSQVLTTLGKYCTRMGNFERSAEFLTLALEIDPDNYKTKYFLAMSYHYFGQLKEAFALIESALKTNPKDIGLLTFMGILLADTGQNEKALRFCKKAEAINDKESIVWSSLGYILMKSGKKSKSKTYYKKALQLDPENIDAILFLNKMK